MNFLHKINNISRKHITILLLIYGYINLMPQKIGISQPTKKKIFVFDFDLTLTIVDTSKINIDKATLKTVFGEHLNKIHNIFSNIVKKGYLIFINTSNNKYRVEKILKKAKLFKYIQCIYGAITDQEMHTPIKYSELWQKKQPSTEEKWALIKCYILKKIQKNYPKALIYFFDDLNINIEKSKSFCKNCYIVKKGNIQENIQLISNFY